MAKLIEMRALALKFLGLAGLFIILSSAISADSARLTQEGFRYSTYLATLPDAKNANNFQGSFIVQTQPTGLFHTTAQNIYTEASSEISNLPIRESILGYLIDNKEVTYDYETVWRTRGWNVIRSATNNALLSATESSRRTGFIRTLELDVQTELGGRRANIGISALGGLRETDNDVIAWQLRGYRTSEDVGANAGLIYRRATENNLLVGANVFLDYEAHDVENFWRYSIGGELRSPWVDIFANTYIGITDPVENSEGTTYTSDGHDVELNVHSPDISWLTGKVTYYNFSGEFGDEDEEGVRFGLKFSPRQVPFVLEIEYEDADEGEESVGGRISYTHEFGAANSGRAGHSGKFTPRDWFYAPVEREYTQRIRTGGGGSNSRSITLMAQVPPGFGVRIFNNSLSLAIVIARGDANNEYSISGTGERGVTLQPLTISMISLEQALVWPIPTEQTVILESDTPINVSFLNGAITTYIGSTVIMYRDSIGLINGIITVATGGGFTSEFLAFQGRSTVTTPTLTGVRIDLSGEATTVSFEHIGNVKLFAGSPTFIINGADAANIPGCGGEIPENNDIDYRCPIDGPVFVVESATYISEPDTTLLRVQSSGNLGALVTYLENRNPRLDLPFARLMTVNGGSGEGSISYTVGDGSSANIRVERNGDIYLVDAAATVNFPRGANERNQLIINIVATDNAVPVEEISPLTVAYIVDVNSQSITPFAVNLLGENRSVPQNGNTEATPILINDAANNLALAVVNINANGGIVLDASAGDANYSYTRLDSAGNVTSDNTPAGNLNLVGSQIVIPQITEASLIRENSVLGITVSVTDIADAAPNIADYTENFVLTLFVILGPIRTDPIVIQFTPINTYAGTTSDGEFRYTATGNNIRINYPYDSTRRSQSTSEEHRDLGRVMMTGGSGFNAAQIQSSGNGIEADIAADGLSPNGNDQTNLTLRIPNNADVDTEQWVVQVTAEDPIAANRTIEYRVDAIRDIGGVADERAASAPENSIVQRDGAYRYRYFTAIATLNGINASDYPQDVVQLGEGEGGRGSINNVLVNSDAPLRYNPATRIISFASEPAANNYEIVVRYTDSDSAAGTNPFLVTVNITSNNDLVNITLGEVVGSTVSGNVIRTPLLDVADPRTHIADIGLSNVTVGGDLLLDPERTSSLEYVRGADITTGMIFSPDNQFAGGIIDYTNEVVRHSIFINAIDNAISVTISYEIRAELTFDTPEPAPLASIPAFEDTTTGIRYTYSGDHDNGISIRVNYPYNSDWAKSSTNEDKAFISIGGSGTVNVAISVLLDTANQAIFEYDDTNEVIRLISETPPADTTAPYTFNYVPYNATKNLEGITNAITFLGVEDIGGVTDEVAADAPTGGVIQRNGEFDYGYFIALSTLAGPVPSGYYPHAAIQLGTGNGGSGNINSRMVSSSNPGRVTYNPTDRIIRFTSVPVVENYEIVIAFTDTQEDNNRAIPYTVTVNILANNDLVNIGLTDIDGDEIRGNIITTELLDVAALRTPIATVSLVDVTNGSLELDPAGDNSLEYDQDSTDGRKGVIYIPADLLNVPGVTVDYDNEVARVRIQLVLLATNTDRNLIDIPRPIVVLLTFATPTGEPEATDSTYAVDGRRYTYSESGNGISIRVNYPISGVWAGNVSSSETFSDILSLAEADVDFGASDGPSEDVFDRVSGAVRLTSTLAPEGTTQEYTFTYTPRNDAKGLVGVINTVTFVAVPDVGAVAALNNLSYLDGRNGEYRYLIPVALTATVSVLDEPIVTYTPSGGNGNSYTSAPVGALPSVLTYNENTFELSFASEITESSPLVNTTLEVRIAFSESNAGVEAAAFTSTITIEPTTVVLDVYLRETTNLDEIAEYSASRVLPDGATSFDRVEIANVQFRDRDISGRVTKLTGSLGYDDADRRIFVPAGNLITTGVVDYVNDIVRHSIVLLAEDLDTGAQRQIVYTIEYTFVQPSIELINNPSYGAGSNGLEYTTDFTRGTIVVESGRYNIRINHRAGGPLHTRGSGTSGLTYFFIGSRNSRPSRILDDRDGSFAEASRAHNNSIQIGDSASFISLGPDGSSVEVRRSADPTDSSQPHDIRIVPFDSDTGLVGQTVTVRITFIEDISANVLLVSNALVSAAIRGGNGSYVYVVPNVPPGDGIVPFISIAGNGGTGDYEYRLISSTPNLTYNARDRQVRFTRMPTGGDIGIITIAISDVDPGVGVGGRNTATIALTIAARDDELDLTFVDENGAAIANNVLEIDLARAQQSNKVVARVTVGTNIIVRAGSLFNRGGSEDTNARLGDDLVVELPSDIYGGASSADTANSVLVYRYQIFVESEGESSTRELTVRVSYPPLDINALSRGRQYNGVISSFTGVEDRTFRINNSTNELELEYRDDFWESILANAVGIANFANHRNPVLFEVLGGSGAGDRNVRRVDYVSLTPVPTGNFAISQFGFSSSTNGFGYFHGTGNRDTTGNSGFDAFDDGRRLAFYIPATREVGIPDYQGPYTLSLTMIDNNVRATVTASYTFVAFAPLRVDGRTFVNGIVANINNPNELRYIPPADGFIPGGIGLTLSGGEGIYNRVVTTSPLPFAEVFNAPGFSPTYEVGGTNTSDFSLHSDLEVGRYTVNIRFENQDPSLSGSNLNLNYIINVATTPIEGNFFAISPEGVTNTITNINGATLSLNVGDLGIRAPVAYINTPQALTLSVTSEGDLNIVADVDNRVIVLPDNYPQSASGEPDAANNLIRSSIIVSIPDEIYGLGTLMLTLFVETHYESRILFSPNSAFTSIIPVFGLTTRIEFRELSPLGGWEIRYPPGLRWNRTSTAGTSFNSPGRFSDILGEKLTGNNVGALQLIESSANPNAVNLQLTGAGPTTATSIVFILDVDGQAFPQTLFVVEEIEQAFVTVIAAAGVRSGQTAGGETFYRIVPDDLGPGAPVFRISIEGGSDNYDINGNLLGDSLGSRGIDISPFGSDGHWDIAFTGALPRISPAEFRAGRVYTLQIAVVDTEFPNNSNTLEILIAPTDFEGAGVEVYVDGRAVPERLIEHPLFAISDIADNRVVASVAYRPGAVVSAIYGLGGNTFKVNQNERASGNDVPGILDFFDRVFDNNGLIRFRSDAFNYLTGAEIDRVNNIIVYVLTLEIADPTALEADLVTIRASASYTLPNIDFIPGVWTTIDNDEIQLDYASQGIQIETEGTTIRAIYPPNRPLGWLLGSGDEENYLGEFRFRGGDLRPSLIGSIDGITFDSNNPIPPVYYREILRADGSTNPNTPSTNPGPDLDNQVLATHTSFPFFPVTASFQTFKFTLQMGTREWFGSFRWTSIPAGERIFHEQEWTFEAIAGIAATRVTTGQLGDSLSDAGYNYDFVRPYELQGVTVFRYIIPNAEFDEPAFRVSVVGGSGSYTGSARLEGQPTVRLEVEAVAGETDIFDITFLNNPASVNEEDFIDNLAQPSNIIVSFQDNTVSADQGGSTEAMIGIVPTDFLHSGYIRDGNRNGNFGSAITVSLNYADYVAGTRIANIESRVGISVYGGTGDGAERGIAANFANGDITLASFERYLGQADADTDRNVLVEETTIVLVHPSILTSGGTQDMVIILEVHYDPATISFESADLFDGRNPIILDDSLQAERILFLNYPLGGEWNFGTNATQRRSGAFTFTQGDGDLGELATTQSLEARLLSGVTGITFDTASENGNPLLRMNFTGTAPRGVTVYQIEVDLVDSVYGVIDRQVFDLRIIEGFTFTDNIITPPTGNQALVQFGGDRSDSPYYRYITPNHNTAGGITLNLIGGSGDVDVSIESNPSGVPITYVPAESRLSFSRAIRTDELFSVTVLIDDTTQNITLTSAFVIEGSDQQLNIEFIDITTNQFFETDTLRRDIEITRAGNTPITNQRIEIAQITVYGDLLYTYTKVTGGLNIEASGRISTPVDRSLGGEIDYTDPDGDGHGEVLQSVVFEMSDGTNTQLATLYAELLFENPRGAEFDLRRGSSIYSIEGSSGPRNILIGDVYRSYTIWITYPNGNQDWVSGPISNDFTQDDIGGNIMRFDATAAGGRGYQYSSNFNNDVLGFYNLQIGSSGTLEPHGYFYVRNRPTPSSDSAILAITLWEDLNEGVPAQVTGTVFVYAVEQFSLNQSINTGSAPFIRGDNASYRYVIPRTTLQTSSGSPPANGGIGAILDLDITGGSGDLNVDVSTASNSGLTYDSPTQEIRTTRVLVAGVTSLITIVVTDNNEDFRVQDMLDLTEVFTIVADETLIDAAFQRLDGSIATGNFIQLTLPARATVTPVGQLIIADTSITNFNIRKTSGNLLYSEITRLASVPDNLIEGGNYDAVEGIAGFSAVFVVTDLEDGGSAEIAVSVRVRVTGNELPRMIVGASVPFMGRGNSRANDLGHLGLGYNLSDSPSEGRFVLGDDGYENPPFSGNFRDGVASGTYTYLINTFYNGPWVFFEEGNPVNPFHTDLIAPALRRINNNVDEVDAFRLLDPNGNVLAVQDSSAGGRRDFDLSAASQPAINILTETGAYSGFRLQNISLNGNISRRSIGPASGGSPIPPDSFEDFFVLRFQPFNPITGVDGSIITVTVRVLQDIAILDDIASGVNYLGQSAGSYTYFTSSAPASGAGIDLNIDGGTGTYDVVATVPTGGPITYNETERRLDFTRTLADGDVYTVTVIASEGDSDRYPYGDTPYPSTVFISITATGTSFATDIVQGTGIGGTNIITGMTIMRSLSPAGGSAIAIARINGTTPASGAITKEEGSLRINSTGLISLPTTATQITTGIVDYANSVIRHYIVLNAVQNSVTLQTRLDVELSFTPPAIMVHAPDSAFTDRLAELGVTINDFTTGPISSGEISIQINYPHGGPWGGNEALSLDETLREFIGLSAVDDPDASSETFFITDANGGRLLFASELDGAPYTVLNADGRASALQAANNTDLGRNVVRLLDGIPPADTTEPYEMYIRPAHGSNSLVGDIITLKLYAVEDIGVDSFGIASEALTVANGIYELDVDDVVGFPVAILTVNRSGGINTGSGVEYDVSISVEPSGNDDVFVYSEATRRLFVNRPLDSRQTYTLSLGISSGFGAAPFSGSLTIGFTGSCESDPFHADRRQVYSDVGSLSGLRNDAIALGVGMPGSRSLLFLDEGGTPHSTSARAPVLSGDFSTTFLGNPLVIRIFQLEGEGATRTGLGTRIAIGNAYVDNFAVYTDPIPESSGRYTLITYYSRTTEETRVATVVEGVNECVGSPLLDNLPLGQFIFSGQGEFVRTGGGELGELIPILMDSVLNDEGIIERDLGLVSAPAIDIYRLNIIGNVAITVLEGSTLEYDRSRSIIQIPDDQVTIGSIVIDDSGDQNHYIEHYISLILTDNNNADVMTTLAATVRLLFRDNSRPRALPFYPVRAYAELTATAVNVLSYELTGINDPANVAAVYEVPADGISGFTVSIAYEPGGQWTENSGGATIHFLEIFEVSRPNEIIFEFDSDIFTVIPLPGNRIQIGFVGLEPPSDVLSQYTITARYRRTNSGLFVNIPIEINLRALCADADMRRYYSNTLVELTQFLHPGASDLLWRPYGTDGAGTSFVTNNPVAFNAIPLGSELSSMLSGVHNDFDHIKGASNSIIYKREGFACEGELPPGHTYLDSSFMPTTDHSNSLGN